MLEEKAHRYGRTFGKVDRWFSSTQLCSVCGVLGGKNPLHIREWACTCGARQDKQVFRVRLSLDHGREAQAPLGSRSVPAPVVMRPRLFRVLRTPASPRVRSPRRRRVRVGPAIWPVPARR
ncbi:transposase [Nocardia donostiensis]|nr:transposase [Nocardia donostiensis]